MNSNDLLRRLRLESDLIRIADIEAKLLEVRKAQLDNPLPIHKLLIYNYEIFLEIQQVVPSGAHTPINEKMLSDMEKELNNYMTKQMPYENEYRTFIRIVSVYLTFIARKPLHPPSMFSENGQVIYKDGITVCPLRSKEITKSGSLCQFCVSTI